VAPATTVCSVSFAVSKISRLHCFFNSVVEVLQLANAVMQLNNQCMQGLANVYVIPGKLTGAIADRIHNGIGAFTAFVTGGLFTFMEQTTMSLQTK
jgi:hypothetical protein